MGKGTDQVEFAQRLGNTSKEPEYANDEIDRLRNLLREAGDELEWLIDARNNSGAEGPPRVWRLLSKIRNELTPNAGINAHEVSR